MNDEFRKNLKIALDASGLNQAELAAKAGISPAIVSSYLKGKYFPKIDKIEAMAKALGVTTEWLSGRYAEKEKAPPTHEDVERGIATGRSLRIPVVGNIAGGVPIEAIYSLIDDDDPDTWEEIPSEWAHSDKQFFALKVRGDSMEPDIRDGDIAIIEKCYEWKSGHVMAVYVNGYNATLKRVKIEQNGLLILQPFNPSYDARIYTKEQQEELPVKPLGVLVESRKKWSYV